MEIPFAALAALEGIEFCIIGAGPAGITCARSLAAKGRRVLLLEAGGWDWSEQSQASYMGETIGDKYFALDACRLRYFGGARTTGPGGAGRWTRTSSMARALRISAAGRSVAPTSIPICRRRWRSWRSACRRRTNR